MSFLLGPKKKAYFQVLLLLVSGRVGEFKHQLAVEIVQLTRNLRSIFRLEQVGIGDKIDALKPHPRKRSEFVFSKKKGGFQFRKYIFNQPSIFSWGHFGNFWGIKNTYFGSFFPQKKPWGFWFFFDAS